MKLALSQDKGIQILTISGPIDAHQLNVLKAGVTKLFKEGKNRIILELPDVKVFASDVLRELAVLNLFARELSGLIVLAKIDPATKTKIESFAKPPVISCYETREAAMASFASTAATETTPDVHSNAQFPDLMNALEARKKEIQELKDKLRQKEGGEELGKLRQENVELKTQNQTLEAQLLQLLMTRRLPPDAESYDQKIQTLERQLEEMMNRFKQMEK